MTRFALSSALDKSNHKPPPRSLVLSSPRSPRVPSVLLKPLAPRDIEMDHPRPSAQPPNNNTNDKTPVTATSHSPYTATATVTPSHQSHHLSLSPEQNFHPSTSDPSSSSRSKPRMPRSKSFNPSPPHRPEMNRSAHSLYAMAGPGSASQVMFPAAGGDVDNGNDDLTTKGRKRKRLAKACSACHVGYTPHPSSPGVSADHLSEKQTTM